MFVWWVHGIGAQLIATGLFLSAFIPYLVLNNFGLGQLPSALVGILAVPIVLIGYGAIAIRLSEDEEEMAEKHGELRTVKENQDREESEEP